MNDERKLAFVAQQTKQALDHIRTTPNVMHPKGGLSHDKMMSFVTQVTKQGLQHFDGGGAVAPALLPTNAPNAAPQTGISLQNNFTAAGQPSANSLNNAQNESLLALSGQQNIANTLAPQVSTAVTNQNQLASDLSNEAAGIGPNIATAELNQATANNVQNQAAAAASQRGANVNPNLAARGAAQAGEQAQQTSAGQAATLTAQQQLAAQQNLANLSNTQVQQGGTSANALTANTLGEQQELIGANSSANATNAGVAAGNQQMAGKIVGGVAGGAGTAITAAAASNNNTQNQYKGGLIKMDRGGNVLDANARAHIAPHNFALPGGRYPIHDLTHARNALARVSQNGSPEEIHKVRAAVHSKYPNVGVKKMVDGGAVELDSGKKGGIAKPPPLIDEKGPKSSVGKWLKSGAKMYDGGLAATGGNVKAGPGQQPVSTHDTIKNDKVPAMLTGGEVVMDLDTLHDKGPIGQMARVVAAHIAKRNKK